MIGKIAGKAFKKCMYNISRPATLSVEVIYSIEIQLNMNCWIQIEVCPCSSPCHPNLSPSSQFIFLSNIDSDRTASFWHCNKVYLLY